MAAGDTLLIWTALANEPPDDDFATFDTRNSHPVLDFDAAADEYAVFSGVLPRHYAGGGLTARLHFAMSSATSDTVIWQVSVERVGEGEQDIDADGFAAAQSSGAVTVPATSGHVAVAEVAFTDGAQMDSLAVGEGFRLRVMRDAVNDDATGDAELRWVELLETPD